MEWHPGKEASPVHMLNNLAAQSSGALRRSAAGSGAASTMWPAACQTPCLTSHRLISHSLTSPRFTTPHPS